MVINYLEKCEGLSGSRIFLRNEMKRQKKSQASVAKAVGISRTLLTKISGGSRELSVTMCKALAKELNIQDWRLVAEVYDFRDGAFYGDEGHIEKDLL